MSFTMAPSQVSPMPETWEMRFSPGSRSLWLPFVAAAWLAGCPVGCPKGNPETIYEGPVEDVHLVRLSQCVYRATPPLQHGFPHEKGPLTGAYFVEINEQSAVPKWVSYDPGAATFTISETICSNGVSSLRVSWHSLVRTVNE